MRKYLFLILLIPLIVVGCSEEEEDADTQNPETTEDVAATAESMPTATISPTREVTVANVDALMRQARIDLDEDDFPNARPFLNGAASLINDELIETCGALSSVQRLLGEAANADTIEDARAKLDEARDAIADCDTGMPEPTPESTPEEAG